MKKLKFIALLASFYSLPALSQEICNNGIDDDGDTFVDLNDGECDCVGLGLDTISSLIPNPSFEDYVCCPTGPAQLNCAEFWIQASSATSDYFNTCGGFINKVGHTPPMFPLPGAAGGAGYGGFYDVEGWKEYIGACLTSPLLAGTAYTLNLWIAWGDEDNSIDFTFYGTPDCTDLPWGGGAGYECPTLAGLSWQILDQLPVTCTVDGAWQEITLTFTPTVDINAVCMGGPCSPAPYTWNYFYVDELVLLDSTSFVSTGNITESGSYCNGDLALNTTIDTTGGAWQWYFNGVAMVGETGTTVDVMATGAGTYQAVYTLGTECLEMSYTLAVPALATAEFDFEDQCLGDPVAFNDLSSAGTGTIVSHDWDFGDGGTSTLSDPVHNYAATGTYTVELIVESDGGCIDTVYHDVNIYPVPNADFEFEINGESSAGGLVGGCIFNTVFFIDGSTIPAPGVITEWDWSFGDGGSSSSSDPSHDYTAEGTYTVELTVTTAFGCTDTYEMEIVMTSATTLDIIFNNPTCFGFTDGSVTADIDGGVGSPIIEITNDADVLVNIGGSNTANSLGGGWYHVFVDDGSGCTAEGDVFLIEPAAIDVDMSLQMIKCFGETNGYAVVDAVLNAQGDLSNITYIWSPDPMGISGLGADSLFNLGAGTYSLIVNDDFGCANEFTFTITQPDELVFAEIGYDPAYCRLFSYQNGNGVVYAAATGGTPDYEYEWVNLCTGDVWPNTTWGGLNPCDYEITVIDDNGCILTQILTVDSLNPIAEFDVTSAELNGNLEGTAVVCATFSNESENFANPNDPLADTTFFWNLNNPNVPWILTHDYYATFDTCYAIGGQYEVCLVAQNKNGCVDTTCKTITVFTPLEFQPVNIFTPDGDGINDVYTFTYLAKGVKSFHCTIVNRWGTTLAEIDDINAGWDGTDKSGSQCRDGVYFFTYQGEAENSEPFSGQGTIQIVASNLK